MDVSDYIIMDVSDYIIMDSNKEFTPQISLTIDGIFRADLSTDSSVSIDVDDVPMVPKNDYAVIPDVSCGKVLVVPARKSVSIDSLFGPSQIAANKDRISLEDFGLNDAENLD
ncbi:hypothetical protein CLU79DRAFT_839118 [Phycomyces nitens]|nr:hypothetical protein CLU79DRAFT_839118 [Phycomyces nitens]